MCDVSDGFKLCTCVADGPVDWTLFRALPLDGMLIPARGIVIPRDEDAALQALFLLEGLNSGEVFDFEYAPEFDDQITFHAFGPADMTFRFDGERWVLLDEQIRGSSLAMHGEHAKGRFGLVELGFDMSALIADPTPERRAIVADQLMEDGQTVLGTWLSLENRRQNGLDVDGETLRNAARKVSLTLRAALGDGEVICKTRCPKSWAALERTEDPRVRRCTCGITHTFVDRFTDTNQVMDASVVR